MFNTDKPHGHSHYLREISPRRLIIDSKQILKNCNEDNHGDGLEEEADADSSQVISEPDITAIELSVACSTNNGGRESQRQVCPGTPSALSSVMESSR